ncbi:MAG: Fe-S protein assembly co-chaperone HscB [Ginsengibacter sp.]
MNYFELFEMPVSLTVAQDELSAKYLALQKKYDPDLFSNENKDQQGEMQEKSSMINKGLKILNDPEEIIKYVLSLKGLLKDEEKYELPAGFIMEMMELNEGLMEGDILNIEEAETKIFQLQKSLYQEVQNIIEGYSDDTTTGAQLLQVKDYYYKKKYLDGILERLGGMRNIAG